MTSGINRTTHLLFQMNQIIMQLQVGCRELAIVVWSTWGTSVTTQHGAGLNGHPGLGLGLHKDGIDGQWTLILVCWAGHCVSILGVKTTGRLGLFELT